MSLFTLFRRRDPILQALAPEKRVKICGIIFVIRKLCPIDYMAGFKAVAQVYDTYSRKKPEMTETIGTEKVKRHYADVFLAAVKEPALTREEEQGKFWVESLFNNWEICEKLYSEIMEFTYGKKKLRSLISQKSA